MNGDWQDLLAALEALRARVLHESEARMVILEGQDPTLRLHPGVRNMLHYLALRRVDLRPLQEALAGQGLSSLGRAESHVLDTLDHIIALLSAALGRPEPEAGAQTTLHPDEGMQLLARNTERLLGPAREHRSTRIMVTLPGERADDPAFFQSLLAAGMDVARINCAHDGPEQWRAMVKNLHQAVQEQGGSCRILADLAGHKIRTGPLPMEPGVVHLRPRRDRLGRVQAPAHLRAIASTQPPAVLPAGVLCVLLPTAGSPAPKAAEELLCVDARGKERVLVVEAVEMGVLTLHCMQGTYLINGNTWRSRRRRHCQGVIAGIPETPVQMMLAVGDALLLSRDPGQGRVAVADQPARVACTIPALVERLPLGQAVWVDDGKMAAVVEAQGTEGALLRITHAKAGGARLLPDRGLNFPGLPLNLPSLSDKDLADLDVIIPLVDMVGFSFVESGAHMAALLEALQQRQASHLGIIAKVETAQAFHRLPEILLAALGREPLGVMVARGDLAVEVGPERLTEVQEEILWLAEAAHLPVIWATQVLETLTRKGSISRPELTDAAMGVRAECVMLNKGPFVVEAVGTLDDILTRMQDHQRKKFTRLRALHWQDTGS
ncbi:MAG: pyruvate kinase [Acidithiobacillus sp.]